jgi:hypothetical protein
MSDNILLRLVHAQAQSVDEVLESWRLSQNGPLSASSLSQLVHMGVRMYEDLENAYRGCYEHGVKDASMSLEELQQQRHFFEEAVQVSARATHRLWGCLQQIAQATGQSSQAGDQLQETAERFRQLQARLAEEWPVASVAEEQQAWSQHELSQALEIDNAFAEIAGVDRATWLERVAEHKRKYPQAGQE